jgi:hypothetical protein
MPKKIFTESELADLARSGAERAHDAIDTLPPADALAVCQHVIGLYRGFHQLYHGWMASISTFVTERHGHTAAAEITALDDVLALSAREGFSLEQVALLQSDLDATLRKDLEAGNRAEAKSFYSAVESGARGLHDFYRDAVSMFLSRIYRRYGVDDLEASLRASSELDWMPWMLEEIESDPRARLIAWAELLGVGNFATLAIEEDDEKFIIRQDPCGSCGRQHRDGRYDEPWNLAMVGEKHALTYGEGPTTIYRSHIPMMHYVMPMERIGAPWPLIRCPREKAGICRVHLYKNPRQPVDGSEASWSS